MKLVLIIFAMSFKFAAAADFEPPVWSNFTLERDGGTVCEVNSAGSKGTCFETLRSLGLDLSDEVEALYPQISSYSEWASTSPKGLPKDERSLKALGGAILLAPSQADLIKTHLRQLDVRDLSILIPHPVHQVGEIPFALSVDWTDTHDVRGTLYVVGTLKLVDQIFSLNLNQIGEFRDRFVSNVCLLKLSGDNIPLDESNDVLKSIIAPTLAGKYVSNARIGFNKMELQLQKKLQETIDQLPLPNANDTL